ncbi:MULTISPECIES: hypothetical protein [Bacteroidota]|uniref:hypothetical protein n=1 Tax=Bacteroidota TaxID=976 RepID=UPI001CBADF7C|nr:MULTISPECIES: hypothetical protein [Bacteroidota]MBZ4190754.1 hypothetical protein [Niabella beijingensis]UMQ40854.1 hypothetical protein MKS83_15800 [Chryseobacterium sp. Y16C]
MANEQFNGLQNTPFGEPDNRIDFKAEASTRYAMESENFVFVITVEVNKHNQISPFFGIQPKAITKMGTFKTHNFKKIAPQDCELTIMLIPSLKQPFWNVAKGSAANKKVALDIFAFLEREVVPIINIYANDPDLFDAIEPSDLSDKNMMHEKLYGMHPAGMPSRTAWMLAMYYENTDLARAKAFARYGLENLGAPTIKITPEIQKMLDEGLVYGSVFGSDPEEDTFFGIDDMKRIDKMELN